MNKADATCCLSRKGSIHDGRCIIYEQREEIMSKASWLRGHEMDGFSCAGRSLLEIIEDELDDSFDALMDKDNGYDEETLNKAKGRAEGLTFAIAIIKGPYAPNIDAIKGQAVERYRDRQAEKEAVNTEPVCLLPDCGCDGTPHEM